MSDTEVMASGPADETAGDGDRCLTPAMRQEIEQLCRKYPRKQAVTLPALHLVHEKLRHVPRRAVVEIAELLELSPAEVQDTLSFYGFFKQDAPHGDCRVWVCRSISCALRGGEDVFQYFCRRAQVEPGQTTADGSLTIEVAECLGACEQAPCMLAGNELIGDLTEAAIDRFLKQREADS